MKLTRTSIVLRLLAMVVLAMISGCLYESKSSSESQSTTETITSAVPSKVTATEKEAGAKPAANKIDPKDWPYWRGPQYNNASFETGLIDDWNPKGGEGSHVAWKRSDLGTRSTPIVMNGKLYVMCRAEKRTAQEGERVICLDAATGKTLWENRFNVWLSDVPDTRVGWSSVAGDPETGNVYALGVCGFFQCIDGNTGKTIWSHSMHEQFGALSTYGGRTNFPIISGDLVITSAIVIGWGKMAKPAHRFLAFNKHTGENVWFSGTRLLPYDTTYSAPALTNLGGKQSLVFGSGDGQIWAMQPQTGRPIWNFDFSRRGINTPPVVVGQTIIAGHSEENNIGTSMGGVVAIDGNAEGDISKTGAKWRVFEMMLGKTAPLVIGDRVYCFDDRAKLHVLDLKTGEPVVRKKALGTVMRASPLYADGKIYCLTESGRWYILKPDQEKGVEVLTKGRLPSGEACQASPIVSHGRLYFTSSGGIYCLVDPEKQSGLAAGSISATSTSSEDTSSAAAWVQLVPAESMIRPGEKIEFKVNIYNANGKFMSTQPAKFTLDGPGQMDASGLFTAPDGQDHLAIIVTANVGDLAGQARVRVVPPLPWSFTFDELDDAPLTWVGARYRHIVREVDGSKALVKVTTIPKGARSRCWFGHPELANYTIEADIKGAEKDGKMPDIGLIAQGYTIDLQGANQKLQIRTWVTQLRMATTIDFPWKPNTWYKMKLQASVEGDQAHLKGKVWLKGTPEPEKWTIEAVDKSANTHGSPGLFGNAKDAEIHLDNIRVYSNDAP